MGAGHCQCRKSRGIVPASPAIPSALTGYKRALSTAAPSFESKRTKTGATKSVSAKSERSPFFIGLLYASFSEELFKFEKTPNMTMKGVIVCTRNDVVARYTAKPRGEQKGTDLSKEPQSEQQDRRHEWQLPSANQRLRQACQFRNNQP